MQSPPPSMHPASAAAVGSEVPDLRHQFLTQQLRVSPGQIVMLPPLTGDKTLQTIQIMTPVTGNNFSVQTLVLPVMKVQNNQPATPVTVGENKVINEEDLYLNKIDETGLPQVMQGIDLDQVKRFAAEFKTARINLGLTQAQVGEALNTCSTADQISVSQSTICRFEKLEITALQVKKLLPALQSWLAWAQQRHAQGLPIMTTDDGAEVRDIKRRKKRTVFIKETVLALNQEFETNSNPTSFKLSEIADRLGLDKETTRVWFCNKRQHLKKQTDQ